MKKTLIITLEFPPQVGGIATYVHQFASALPAEDIVVYAPKYKNSKEWDKKNAGYKIIRKKPYFPKLVWPRWLKMYLQIKKIVKQEKIEMIYLHHVLPVGYIGYLIKKFKKIPYIIFSHGTDILYATKSEWKKKMTKKICLEAEQIIFNSENLKHRLIKVLPEFENKTSVLYPCPTKDFYVAPNPKDIEKVIQQYALEGKKVILTVSRLDEGKGITHLVRMMPEILKKIPNLVWFIIGDGPKKNQMLKNIQKNNLQNIVRFIGEIPHEQLKKYYYTADLFVLLTHPDEGREEGLGLVFLEAAACGIPVVAGKSGGVPEAVLHTQTGIIVDIYKGDKNVINSIVELLKNEEYAKELGRNAQKRIQNNFQWEHQLSVLNDNDKE